MNFGSVRPFNLDFANVKSGFNCSLLSRRGQASPAAFLAFCVLILAALFFGKFVTAAPAGAPLILCVALAVFAIAFFRMDIALILVIVAMLFSPELSMGNVPKRAIAIRIEDILIVVLGMAWLARTAIMKETSLIPRTPLNWIITIYTGCFLISTSQAIITSGINPLKATFYVLKYLEYFILFFLVAGTLRGQRTLWAFLIALLATFFFVNLYATSQTGQVGRVSAPFEGETGEPNTLGGYQILMLCVTLGLLCHTTSKRISLVLGIIALSTIWPLLHTLSRASFMALIPAYLALIAYCRTHRKMMLILFLLGGVVAAMFFMPDVVKERIAYTFQARPQEGIEPVKFFGVQLDPSSSARWNDWTAAVDYWKRKPFFGYGLTGLSFMDSQYVNNLVELGICGFLAFALLIALLHYQVLRIYRAVDNELVKGLALGFAAGNVGILVHALTVNTFILIRIMEPYWFMAAMIMAWPRIEVRDAVAVQTAALANGHVKIPAQSEPAKEKSVREGKPRNIDMFLKDRKVDGT